MRVATWAWVALSVLACGPSVLSAPEAAREARADAIVGGTVAVGDPAVVQLAVSVGGGQVQEYCTGTLVAPRTVVTAAHCINAYGAGDFYVVGFGANVGALTKVVPVVQQVAHPNYRGGAWDFGVLRLGQAVTGVTPIPLNERPLTAADVGRPIRHVGFGITSPSGAGGGVKREVTYALRQVAAYAIESGAPGQQTCQGDSGGPGFMVLPGSAQEQLVGVVSFGDQSCAYEGWDGRVDVAAGWIRSTMGAWEAPTCAADGACVPGCTPVDQDCACAADGRCTAECEDLLSDPDCPRDCARDGVCAQGTCPTPDPDCVNVGSLCSAALQCRERLCTSDAQHPNAYCSRACATAADCPSMMTCAAGSCRYPIKPERRVLEPCSRTNDFCVASICTGPVGGISRCVAPCIVSSDCAGGATCEAGADSQRYCRPQGVNFKPTVLPSTQQLTGPAAGCASVGLGFPSLWLLALLFPRARRRRTLDLEP